MGLSRFFRRARWDRERRDELDSYLRIETDENLARGMDPAAARDAAHKKLGNRTLVREEIYRMNTLAILDTLARDVRYALRTLRQNRTFTAAALLTLAIGIGANTAVFSVVNSVLLKPLAYPHPEELVAVWQKAPGAPGLADVSGDLRLSVSQYFAYSENNRTFQALGIWFAATSSVTGLAEPEEVPTVAVSDGTLQALSVQPLLGRLLTTEDQKPGAGARLLLGHGYWQRRFGADRSVIGRSLTVNSRSYEIVGVMPAGLRIGNTTPDLIVPAQPDRSRLILAGFGWQGIGRLKPGVTIAQANADLARALPIWMDTWTNGPGTNPHSYENWRITPDLRPLKQDVVGNVGSVLWVVMGTIGIVMLIACANVANLLLVRADARQQELAIRAALGAGWGRIVRDLLVESVLLGVLGGALGLVLAYGGLQYLVRVGPGNLPRLNEIGIDQHALAFAFCVSILSGILFGLIPALKYAGPRIANALRTSDRTSSHSRERHRARNLLVVSQVALALVLLVSSGLMIRTFHALRQVRPGFRPEHLQTVRIAIPQQLVPEPERVVRMQNAIADKLASIPEVASVGFVSLPPMSGLRGNWDSVVKEGEVRQPGTSPPMRVFRDVSPGYFQSAGTRVIAGRDYTWTDLYDKREGVLISENLASELWGNASSAVGKRMKTTLPISPWREVIGVVENVRDNGAQQPAPAIVYWPSFGKSPYSDQQVNFDRTVTFLVRSGRAGTESFQEQIRKAVWSVNGNLTLAAAETMQEIYDRSMARSSFTLVMLAIAGSMALVLGVIGIYGVVSYAVSQRTREIGIRLALGAEPSELKRMFVRHAFALAAFGIAIGLAAASGLTRLMASLLFGVSSLDPATYLAVPVVLLSATVVSSYLPARRAAAVDPNQALRSE